MADVTIIPTPCRKPVWPGNCDVKCGDRGHFFGRWYCSENCKPLGAQLAIRGTYVDHDECGPSWEDSLTWNLTLAALLNAAASQAIEQVLHVEEVLGEGMMKALTGPLHPYTDEPIHLLKKTVDKVWADTPQETKDHLHAQATPENLAAFEKVMFGTLGYTVSEDDPDREPGDGLCHCGERLDKPHFHGEF